MFINWAIPLFMGVVGGPLALLFKFWYKKETNPSKFADNGAYVRDDSLYSYDESGASLSEDSGHHEKQLINASFDF
ncbi:MAG: hypothetical protein ACREBI_07345 [Nitrosotalea sp.]